MEEKKFNVFIIIFFPFYLIYLLFKQMKKFYGKTIYLFTVISLLATNYFMGGAYTKILAYALIAIPIISLLYTLVLFELMKVETEIEVNDERFYNRMISKYNIKIKLPRFLPIIYNRFSFLINCNNKKIKHDFNVKKQFITNSGENISFQITFIHKGENEINLKSIFLTDIFDIKKFRRDKNIITKVKVYPRVIPLTSYNLKPIMNEVSLENSNNKGDQYYSIREYAKGDPLNKIHWKLTHKFKKQFSKTTDYLAKKTTIFYDNRIAKNCTKKELFQYQDNITEVLLSLIKKYLNEGYSTDIKFFTGDSQTEIVSVSHGDFQYAYDNLSFVDFATNPSVNLLDGTVEKGEEYVYITSTLDKKTLIFLEQISHVTMQLIIYYVPTIKEYYEDKLEELAEMHNNFKFILVDNYNEN